MAPSWVIGKGSKTVAILSKNGNKYDIDIKMNASSEEMKLAANGTVSKGKLICPNCSMSTPISRLRGDRVIEGETVYGLRKWEKHEFDFSEDDIYSERLYAIQYSDKDTNKRYYVSPSKRDLENETKVKQIVQDNIIDWQEKGFVPKMRIENGDKTKEMIITRGWSYWHHLFNARQLLLHSKLLQKIVRTQNKYNVVIGLLAINKLCDWDSKLCRWDAAPGSEKGAQTFSNQALNTVMNYPSRGFISYKSVWFYKINLCGLNNRSVVTLSAAHNLNEICDIWITDPPYGDAINYHELSEMFLAWDKELIKQAFPEWYTDSKRDLAIKGDSDFAKNMIEIYTNLVNHMPDNGIQVVMFTHSDPAVWAQLALIMWKSGLCVTAAWNIATETDATGLKSGNYVKGTVILVLRKQIGDEEAFLDEIDADIREEVKKQIDSMRELDDKEEPNFSDPDYVLAAYAASLKVLTSYAEIEEIELEYELDKAINSPKDSVIVGMIENAKKIAYECVIPLQIDNYLWKELSNGEKYYLKGLENEKRGNYQLGTYQEFSRGFNVGGYNQLLENNKANTARLKTPVEMGRRTINEVPDFETSILRIIFIGINTAIKEDENPQVALKYIKSELGAGYWAKRNIIKQLLEFIKDTNDIDNMKEHWGPSADMADLLYSLVSNDGV